MKYFLLFLRHVTQSSECRSFFYVNHSVFVVPAPQNQTRLKTTPLPCTVRRGPTKKRGRAAEGDSGFSKIQKLGLFGSKRLSPLLRRGSLGEDDGDSSQKKTWIFGSSHVGRVGCEAVPLCSVPCCGGLGLRFPGEEKRGKKDTERIGDLTMGLFDDYFFVSPTIRLANPDA